MNTLRAQATQATLCELAERMERPDSEEGRTS